MLYAWFCYTSIGARTGWVLLYCNTNLAQSIWLYLNIYMYVYTNYCIVKSYYNIPLVIWNVNLHKDTMRHWTTGYSNFIHFWNVSTNVKVQSDLYKLKYLIKETYGTYISWCNLFVLFYFVMPLFIFFLVCFTMHQFKSQYAPAIVGA